MLESSQSFGSRPTSEARDLGWAGPQTRLAQHVRQCVATDNSLAAAWRQIMGSKDKGGKNTKSVAKKNLKEKRRDKQEKRAAAEAERSHKV